MCASKKDKRDELEGLLRQIGVDASYGNLRRRALRMTRKIASSFKVVSCQDIAHFLDFVIRERYKFWTVPGSPLRDALRNIGTNDDPSGEIAPGVPMSRHKSYMNRVETKVICEIVAVYASSLTVSEAAKLLCVSDQEIEKRLEFNIRENYFRRINKNAPDKVTYQKLFGRKVAGEWRISSFQFGDDGRLINNHQILMRYVGVTFDLFYFYLVMIGRPAKGEMSRVDWVENKMMEELSHRDETDREQYMYYFLDPSAGY